jgi:hypothetical protein
MNLILYVVICAIILAVLALIRNVRVYQIRMAILWHSDLSVRQCNINYDKLPSYDYMFACPKQWHMWTVNQYKNKYIGK